VHCAPWPIGTTSACGGRSPEMPRSSPRILDCRWGRVSIDGHGAVKDTKLYPGGARAWDWGKTGRRAVQPMMSIQIVGSPRDRVGSGRFACGAEDGIGREQTSSGRDDRAARG
jgi:hypothetical protein